PAACNPSNMNFCPAMMLSLSLRLSGQYHMISKSLGGSAGKLHCRADTTTVLMATCFILTYWYLLPLLALIISFRLGNVPGITSLKLLHHPLQIQIHVVQSF